jgi:hypothetical protein
MKNPFASWSIYVSTVSWRADEGRQERLGGLFYIANMSLNEIVSACSPAR